METNSLAVVVVSALRAQSYVLFIGELFSTNANTKFIALL